MFLQSEIGTVEIATKLFGPMGAVCAALVIALVYVFRLYHRETRARIEDAKASARMLEELAPYVARLARRINRISTSARGPVDEDSDPPPPISRARIDSEDV
jgi:hypothetical protein